MISLTSPVRTRAHEWSAGIKLAALCFATFGLFFLQNLGGHLLVLLLVAIFYVLPGRVFFKVGVGRLWMLWPFLLIVGLWHLIEGSYAQGAVIVLRLLSAVALANLVTMTTKLTDMIAVVHFLASPVRSIGITTRPLEIAIALVIRMTPVLFANAQALSEAWRARAARRASWRIVLPFTILVLDDADHVADALRARGGLISKETP